MKEYDNDHNDLLVSFRPDQNFLNPQPNRPSILNQPLSQ